MADCSKEVSRTSNVAMRELRSHLRRTVHRQLQPVLSPDDAQQGTFTCGYTVAFTWSLYYLQSNTLIFALLFVWNLNSLKSTMARRYDSRTTIFSPEGRLYQVEYAMEAIGHAGTCLGILASDGIVLAAEKRNTNKLLDEVFSTEKIYKLHDDMACSVGGITSDANVLINKLRSIAQCHLQEHGESVPCELLVSNICDIKQAYTQFGGKRPFGVSILYMGWDVHYGFQLYQSDPSGNYSGWKATCIGNNSSAAVSLLNQEYQVGQTNLKQALALAIKVLSKTLDTTKLTGDKLEMATLTREDGKTKIRILPQKEIESYIKIYEQEEAHKAEAAKKSEEKGKGKK